MVNFSNVIIQFNIYVGLPLLFIGVFGNLLNIIIFYKTKFQNPSTFILFCYSFFSLAYISLGLFTRVMAGGFLIDWTTINMNWCRARYYISYVNLFCSISYMCYAAMDQFFATSQKQRLRQLSSLVRVQWVVFVILIFCLLFNLPILMLTQQVPTTSGALVCNSLANPYLKQYISYFVFPVVLGIVPVTFLIIIGISTYRHVSQLRRQDFRQRAQRNLTSMILLQTTSVVIGSVPYTSYNVYSAITSTVIKSPDHVSIENLILQVFTILYYFPYVTSFCVYLISSETFRDQVRKLFHLPPRQNRIEPSRIVPFRVLA